jgi:dimethylhistidine N-methyltransferase
MSARFSMIRSLAARPIDARRRFADDVRAGLGAKTKRLSCRYFYDDAGSHLFERICELEEYYLPRAEHEILERESRRIAALAPSGASLVELGSGNAAKTTLLIHEMVSVSDRLRYVPLDVSESILEESSERLLSSFPSLAILAICSEYDAGFDLLIEHAQGPKLILWLGSNIGNFDRPGAARFLARVRSVMSTGDRLLVGIDLRKDKETLERAYDDSAGVTAEFNKNILVRINRELDADFDPASFRHLARWDEDAGRIEMYLVSTRAQRVRIGAAEMEVAFASGEAVHTEDSYKYGREEIAELARAAGLEVELTLVDSRDRFADCLFRRAP